MKNLSFLSRAAVVLVLIPLVTPAFAQVPLADQPVFTIVPVPGNLALAVSVEFPTVLSSAHPTIGLTGTDPNYTSATEYLGYFDPDKCYAYQHSAVETDRHFYPASAATSRTCTSAWSGNFLNWVTASTIDVFRWALTGGFRKVDTAQSGSTPGVTWLEKSWSSDTGDANDNRHPFRLLNTSAAVSGATPLGVGSALFRVHSLGNKIWVSVNNGLTADPNSTTPTAYVSGSLADADAIYELSVRVKVCDANIGSMGVAGLEKNCVQYGSTYKPEGLMQKYAEKVRYSTFGYLNDHDIMRDGAALRARQAFIGPIQPVPLSTSVSNPVSEWDPTTGVIYENPRSSDATATFTAFNTVPQPISPILHSGSLNYINKFGQINSSGAFNTSLSYKYKRYDNVGELYYAATRYLKGYGNVDSWTEMSGTTTSALKNQYIDAFPVIKDWNWLSTDPGPPSSTTPTPSDVRDPILYSCQKNFILGIGDVNSHADKNVPGSSISGTSGAANEPTPSSLSPDPVQASAETNRIGKMQADSPSPGPYVSDSLGSLHPLPWCCSNGSFLMAGIAYDSNTRDIRTDVSTKPQTIGKQTIKTYWVDVLEYARYRANNQFYLAAKYGGFQVPTGYNPNTTTPLPDAYWYNTARMSPTSHSGDAPQKMPDNYFVAARADQLVAGLSAAFEKIDADINATTTASATALPQVTTSGDVSYSTTYDPKTWSSIVKAVEFNNPSNTYWNFSVKLAAQLSGTGWQSNRRMATWSGSAGIPFNYSNLTATQKTALDTPWITGDDSEDFLKYLRGDRTKETTSPGYRKRPPIDGAISDPNFVGDIVGSRLAVVGVPSAVLADKFGENGYDAFATKWGPVSATNLGRPTVVYAGTNGGILHAIAGAPFASTPSTTPPAGAPIPEVNSKAGQELFAYVPSALFRGTSASSTQSTRAENGLSALGNPSYVHRYFVNSTPKKFDIDLKRTVAGAANTASCKVDNALTGLPEATNWRTLLIGGLGKGGRSYYALDITDPASITDESSLASKVMWEFPRSSDSKDANLADKVGYSFGEPVAVRTKKHGWVVIFTSGYDSVDGGSYFFLVDPCTGYLVEPPIRTKTGLASSGMAHATAYALKIGAALADAAYAGDLLGNVWRLDLTPETGSFSEAELIAVLTDDAATPQRQPVTTRVLVEYDPKTLDRFVMVGTGRLLDKTDTSSLQKQTFYAFRDGDVTTFNAALKTSSALTRSDFTDISDSLSAGNVFTNQKGWMVDMGKIGDGTGSSYAGIGWRMIDNPRAVPTTGMMHFVATLPNSDDPCTSGAKSIIYAVNFGTGQSLFGPATGSLFVPDRVVDSTFFNDGGGVTKIKYGEESTGVVKTIVPTAPPLPTWRRLNWREIPLSQ